MTREQNYLISLLSAELNGSKDVPPERELDWYALFAFASRNGLLGICYSRVKKSLPGLKGKEVLALWERDMLINAAEQIRMTDDLLSTLQILQEKGVRFLLFKGLVLKRLYDHPEFRLMGDGDILVDENGMDGAIRLLETQGYAVCKEETDHPTHLVMERAGSFPIELHRSLWNTLWHGGRDTEEWMRHIWNHAGAMEFEGARIPVFSKEDELIHLIVHFSTHYITMDTNLMRLYDLGLFLKKYGSVLDWSYVCGALGKTGLLPFFQSLLALYRDSFRLELEGIVLSGDGMPGVALLEDLMRICARRENGRRLSASAIFCFTYSKPGRKSTVRRFWSLLLKPNLFFRKICKYLGSIGLLSKYGPTLKKHAALLEKTGLV